MTTPKPSLRPSKYTIPVATVQTTLDGKPYKSTRYSLNVKLLEGHKSTVGLRAYYIEIFTAMQDFCKGIMLLPWNTEKDAEFIKEPDKLSETITQLRKYVFGARSRDIGEDVYAKINLAFPVGADKPTFEDDFQGCAESRNIRFHETPVQHHNVKGVCWLPYLTNFTNTKLLSEKFTASYAASTKSTVPVPIGCSFRALNDQYDKPAKERIKAVHVECPADYRAKVKNFYGHVLINENIRVDRGLGS